MARFLDGYTPKKKKKDEETQQKKAKSPSVSNNNYKRANQGSDYVSRKDGGQGSGLTRRTANKPTVNRQPSYVNRSNNQPMSRKDGGDGFQTSRRTQTQPQTSARTRTTPATSREWMSRKDGGEGTPRRTATERASDLGSRFAQQARTNRAGKVQDSQWTSRKEGGEGSYRPKTAEEMQRNRKRGFIDDAASVVGSTLKQTAAAEKQYLNTATRGITLKDRDLYATKNQIDEADRRTEERKAKYRSQIKAESAKMEKLKEGHSYLGRMGLDAVSSTTGTATDLAWGPASLAHMYMRSSGASQGDVREKVEPLKQKLRESGNYTDDEIEEMFKDVDKWDAANAMASAGIEVLSEKLFPGIGIGRKVIGGKGASIAEKVMGRLATKVVNKSGVLGNVARGTLEEIAEEEVGGPLQALASNLIYGNRLQAISDDNTRRTLQNQSDDLRSQVKTPEDAQAVAARLNSDEFYNESKQTYLDAGCTEKEADTLANLSRDYLTASLTGDTETMQKCQDKMVDILSEDQKEHFGLQDAIDSAVSTAMMTAATGAPGAITSTQIGNEYKKNAGMDAVRNLADIAVKYDPDNSIKAQTIRDMIDKGEDISGTQVHELIQIASKAATASFEREDAKDTAAERRMRHEGYLISPAVRAEDGSVILEEKTAERYDDIEAGYMEKAAGLSVPAEAADMAVNIATSYDLGVITAEQMNELSDKDVKEAFSDLTGINLNQYNVYDRKGNILVAESNIRMQNALFAKASDNLVESARLEQLNFDDKARGELIESVTRNTASNGAGAVAVAIQTVDTKDKSKMMLMGAAANRVYEMGMYTNQSWDDVRGAVARQFPGLDSDVLGLVFESGKADKAVQETEFYGRSVRAGEGMTRDSISDQTLVPGEVVNTTGRVIGADEMGFLKDTADNFGIKVVIEDVAPEEVKKENGKTVKRIKEGKYDSKSNTLYVNVNEDVRKPLRAIVTHELTHSTIFAPDEMLELIEYIGDAWYRADPEGYKAAIEARREIYKAQDLSDLELLEEIVADGSIDYDFWNDPTLLDDIATKNQTLAEKFLSAIREILRKLRTILANEPAEPQNEKQYTAMYAQVVDMAEAERLMMNALKAANTARADKAVSDWQDAVYAKDDTRDSIGYHAGDLGKSTVDDYYNQGYGRGTGHFGFGTYFTGNIDKLKGYNSKNGVSAPIETVDFDKYNLYKPNNFDKGIQLHDALKLVDGFIEQYSNFSQENRLSDEYFENLFNNTTRINRAAEDLVDEFEWNDYQWDENTLKNKEKVDKYIAEQLDEYDQAEIERKARQKYDDVQNKPIDEDELRQELARNYNTYKGMKDFFGHSFIEEESVEEYIQNELQDTIEARTRNKEIPYEAYYYREAQEAIKENTERWEWKDDQFRDLDSRLASALGYEHSRAEIRDALKKTEQIVKGYSKNERGLDSGATVFMKQLGYEGVDVRHIDGLDNTGFGSVIYDLKDEDLARKQEIGTARFSIAEDQQETILHDVGPDIRFTIGTFRDEQAKGKFIASLNSGKGGFAGLSQIASGKDILRRVMEAKSFAPEQIKAATGFLEHMAGYLESDAVQMKYGFIGWDDLTDAKVSVRKDADGKIVSVAVSAMVVNGEYPVNFDMTTICNKREGVMEIIQALTKKYDADTGKTILNSIKLTDEKMWSINKALKAEGIDTACLGCFVEARRYYTNRFIDKIDDVWNSAVREARKKLGLPEEEYFNFAKGKKVSGEDYNQISDLWTAYDESSESKRSPAQRIKILMDEIVKNKEVDSPYLKLISAEDILTPEGIRGFKDLSTHNKDRDMVKMIKSIYGTSAPKEILAFTPYNSEIALLPDKIKGTPTDEYLRSIGGTRVQSFSDFKMEHFFDHLQMVADEAARGFVNHGYSKVIAYPRLFGLTGRKINMSVMFDVLPASEWQKTLGCDEDTATRVARKYQGLRFVTEKPKENVDNRPYKEVTIEGVHGYLTYLVSDADYVNSVFDRLYQENIDAGMSEVEARRKANTDKPFEQSINYREAVELENKDGYKENVGIIGVAFGDEHLKMLLDDPNVRYIIPYHRSGLPVFIAQKTALDIARDYTDFQNTNKAKGGYWITPDGKNERMKSKYEKFVSDNSDLEYPAITFFDKEINGKGYTVEFGKKNSKEKGALAGTADFDVYENLESVKDIREIANAYLEYCIQHNYVPVFHEFAGHPNYYKMLFDFAVTDGTTTNIYPQKPVKNIYPGLNLDEIVKSGRSIDDLTEDDFKDFYAEINRGLAEQNAKTELRRNNLGRVLDQDLLSKNGENSIISDTNIQHIVNGTPDYTSVRYSNEEVTPEPTAADIRYSMSTTDSEGNILTDGQMEFFKNSQARDEEGRLLNLYHGTVSAGFNMFRADRLIWLTTSRRDADSYGGNWEHKGYDPEEKEQRVSAFGGSYRLDNPFFENYRFDTEEDMQDFIATHPDIDKIKADDELYDMLEEGEIDENEYDRLNKLGEEYEKDYRRYEYNRFGNYTWGDLMDNPEKFTKDDFYRAILEWDKEASVDDLDEVTIEDFLSLMQEEENLHQAEGNTMRDISFRTRIPEGDEGEYVYPVNQRTYEVYANLTNPLIVDIGGKGIEGNYGYVDEMIAGDYDGLILRNCRVGKYHDLGDVVLARQSSQVKLTTNKAPTENPDIRFSMADDNGTMGYAMETAETTDDLWNSDPALEKNRVRYSMSEEDFINMITSRWNEKWLTKGRILDEDSVQKDVMRLAKMVNMNAEDGRKYDSDVLTEITNTAKVLFYMQNSGNEDMANKAAEYAWESANKIIQETEYINDDMYQRYKGIVSYLRDTKIQVPEGLADDAEFSEFIEDNFGKFIVRKKGEDISNVYTHLNKQWPKLFPKLDHPIDQFMQMAEVLDEIQPYREAYSSEEAAALAETVATELMNIARQGEAYVSAADVLKPEFDRKTKALKQRHKEAIERIRTEEKGKRQRQKDRADKWKQRYNDRVQKDKQDRADRTARAEHNKQFGSIQKNYKWLVKRLQDNTKDSNIPEFFKKDLAKMLSVFDLQTEASKKREMHYGPDGYVRRDISNKTLQMEALRTSLEKMHDKYDQFLTNDVITDLIADITKSAEGKSIDALTPVELKKIDDLLKALRHEFVVYNRVRVEGKRIEYAGIGSAQIQSALEHAKKFGAGKDYNKGILGGLDRILNMDELTPAYLFRRIDPENQGLGMMFEQIQNAHDRYIRNTVQIEQWMSEIVGKYHKKGVFKSSAGELEEWRSINHVRKFQLENGETITLTPAQMMSVYCLSNREQAKAHMMGQGVVVAPVSFQATMISDIKQKRSRISHVLTENDIKMIRSTLTDDQVNVANALQELMSTKMAEWGNEASMSVLGIKLFTEKDYFPIKSDRAVLTKDLKAEEFEQAIRNFGFAKAVQPGANNAIMVDDIFSIVAEHCNNMNLYNAYSEAMNDFMKVYNYKNVDESGAVSVEQAVSEAYSQKATAYIMQFMRDLNGNVSGKENTGIADTYNAMLANAKKASVFANIRVAAQQPTAIGRAFMMISPKYAFAMKPSKAAMNEMFEHCPIAKWKSLGYYDINMGRNIESVIMNENNLVEELATAAYGALDNLTWTGIWQMVKAETKDKHPDLEEGTDRYWEACNKRMREVVAFTQVVDSPLHRSHAMRSKTIQAKMTTAFGAEPTITYNMLRDGIVRAVELFRSGDHSGAVELASKTIGVVMFTTALTAGAAAIADVIRGKDPGDDDDEDGTRTLLEIWWSNFLNNFDDNMNPLNNIYYVKDIKSLLEGWENNNLALQGFKYIGLGFNQLTGSKYARSRNSWWENIAYGIGYLTGVPVKTVMTDLGNLIGMAKEKFSIETPITDAWFEKLDSISLAKDDGKAETGGAVIDVGADTEDLPDNLTDEQKDEIRKTGEKRKKKNSKKEEVADRDKNTMLYDAEKSAAGYEGAERDKRIWQSVSQGYKDHIATGDYAYIAQMRSVVEQAGGDLDYFDQRIMEASKSALKKTIEPGGADTESEMVAQQNIKMYLLRNGMSAEELSSEIVYKSAGAKDLKVAFRINDNYEIQATATSLIWAGLTANDYNRLYENRNRIDLKKYNGKYKDRLKSTGKYIWPASGPITSPYGYRNSPTRGASSFHQAIDIGAAYGSPVVAADGGTVIFAGWNGGGGKTVKIQHDDGSVTFYQHLSWWDAKVGDTVSQGQEIGKVGSTGVSTGPHLDFRVQVNGELVDPMKYLDKLN